MTSLLPEPVARVARFLAEARAEAALQEFGAGTPTADAAAAAVGCELDQIVKSLVFQCDGRAALVMVPGSRRADPARVAGALGSARARIASPAAVREATGYEAGGVAPFALLAVSDVLLDRSLLHWETVWVGAGSDRHMVGIAPSELLRLTRARTVDACAPGEGPRTPGRPSAGPASG